jgi:hypothetical protein
MGHLKKLTALALAAAMLSTLAQQGHADEYATNVGGCGYTECCETPCLAPAIALSTIALVAIIAVAVQNHSHHGHGHAHSN